MQHKLKKFLVAMSSNMKMTMQTMPSIALRNMEGKELKKVGRIEGEKTRHNQPILFEFFHDMCKPLSLLADKEF